MIIYRKRPRSFDAWSLTVRGGTQMISMHGCLMWWQGQRYLVHVVNIYRVFIGWRVHVDLVETRHPNRYEALDKQKAGVAL